MAGMSFLGRCAEGDSCARLLWLNTFPESVIWVEVDVWLLLRLELKFCAR